MNCDSVQDEIGTKLVGSAEDDASATKFARLLDILGYIINEESLAGGDAAEPERLFVDQRVWLGDTYGAGVDAMGEVAHEAEVRLHVGYVERVRVGEEGQSVPPRKFREKCIGEDRLRRETGVPGRPEILELQLVAKVRGQLPMPVDWGESAFLPVLPARMMKNPGPNFVRRKIRVIREPLHRPGDVQMNQNPPDVKDNCLWTGRTVHGSSTSLSAMGGAWVAAAERERRDRRRPMSGGRTERKITTAMT